QLLAHLRKRHGKEEGAAEVSLKRVTLKRRTVSELKQASVPGTTTKTISVEVRKQKTYIKRSEVADSDEHKNTGQALKEQVVLPVETIPAVDVEAEVIVPVGEPITEVILEQQEQPVLEPTVAAVVETEETQAPVAPEISAVDLVSVTEERKEEAAATEARKKQREKEQRLEESIKRNADKVRQQASAKQEVLHRKKQEEGTRSGAGGRDSKKPKKKGSKKTERVSIKAEGKHQFEMPVEPIVKEVAIPEMIIVSDLAQKMSVKAAMVIKHLMKLGIMATINQSIDQETAVILVEEMGHKAIMQSDDDLEQEMLSEAQDEDNRVELPRAPIVTIMGHVDHGKTSLLDYIRKTRVAAGEAGGITQHIGAYQVITDHGSVTFLDTPGHAAFTAMRARGADVTDVVIVVVAADDGVMPQTKEAVEHAKAANVPIIVAMNKIDKPDANPDKVMQELANIDVIAEEWGGDVQFLKISAKTGEGIDDLIEALIVQTEILELKAPVEGAASGIVIESRLDKGRGVVATVLIQKGTLESGQMVLCGHEYGRVRAMFNENGVAIKSAGPCAPVEILGLSGTPNAGDEFLVVQNERIAKDLAKHREDRKKLSRHAVQQASKLDEVFSRMATGEIASVNLVLKTDVQGSLEALRSSLVGLSNDEVEVKVVFGGVGGI
ncbi:MAG: translation initiation factor IF-2, partial [Methylobacter sp.]|nr:translation initiation factor IF-2 [Methylobacter sp.]